ncbi:MAG: hypothetical protein WC373_12260 [Smithella sp.]|jgi:hypothetical protein
MPREVFEGFFIYGGEMMWGEITWDDFVRGASMRYGGLSQTPEGIMQSYHDTRKKLAIIRERIKNPVNLKGGGILRPSSIKQLCNKERDLVKTEKDYRDLIKKLVKFNLLPTSKLISGSDRRQFVFSLQTMIELPELGQAVYYANRLMGARHDTAIPSTNDGYVQHLKEPGSCRESMYDALLNSLNEVIQKIQTDRQRLLYSGTPWKSYAVDDAVVNEIESGPAQHNERHVIHKDKIFKVHKGGLCKQPEPKVINNDPILTETGAVWLRAERAKMEDRKNA